MNNYFAEMCSGSKTGSYLRLIDLVYHSTLGLRVIKKRDLFRDSGCRGCGPGCSRDPRPNPPREHDACREAFAVQDS